MKHLYFTLLLVSIMAAACQKDDFIYDYPETDKLLLSISGALNDREFITAFKYDSLNRITEILEFSDGEEVRK